MVRTWPSSPSATRWDRPRCRCTTCEAPSARRWTWTRKVFRRWVCTIWRGSHGFSIGIAEGNTPVLDFTGPYGEARVSVEVDEEGLPSLVLMDGDGNDRVAIRIDRRGNPHFEFLDADGRPVRQEE